MKTVQVLHRGARARKRVSHYLDVTLVLAQKDFKLRYRNSVLGFLWSLLNPLAYMVVLTLVFAFLIRVTVHNFPVWVLLGILVWRFFSIGTSQGLFSMVTNPSLVSKVYIPRYLIILSNNLANFLAAVLEFLVLIPLMLVLGVALTPYILVLPIILILEFFLVFAMSLSLAALNVKYRDVYELWDIGLALGFFLSPIVYDASLIPARYQFAYSLNPVTRLMEALRGSFLFARLPSAFDLGVISAIILVLLTVGISVFKRFEGRLAEAL